MPYRIFIRVLLPAPFSPQRACTLPHFTVIEMLSFASTSGNLLVMPRSSMAVSVRCWAGWPAEEVEAAWVMETV